MKVALVQRNAPLEIVVNMHSKRKTEQLILFDSDTRFYGSDAKSLIGRKPTFTPYSMNMLLGRDESHPIVQDQYNRYNPIEPYYNETRSGVNLKVASIAYTPEELVAMVLSHAKDFTVADGVTTQIKDCVLTVPSFYTQHERRAILDAASLADLNVLALIDETTAAGLHFGIDRIDEEPMNVLFYNMGGNSIQVSIIQYHSHEKSKKKVGAFRVLGKGWDSSIGGDSFDARLVDFMADEFNTVWNKKRNDGEEKDVRKYPRPISKLKLEANKIKQVLSANNDKPIFIDSLHDDINYQSTMTRSHFEELCHELVLKSTEPIQMALRSANLTLADINAVELIGGGMRVPKVQEQISSLLGESSLELGMHINSDESMALGAAFHGANVSTAFRVRQVGMTDINPFPIVVSLQEMEIEESSGLFGIGGGKKKKEEVDGAEVWSKQATIFKANGKVGVKKTIAFTQEEEINVAIDYEDFDQLPAGTPLSIERYNVTGIVDFAKEMEEKGLGKPKVSLQFDLSTSGLAMLVKAEAAVEETYMGEEEIEVEDEDQDEEDDASDNKAKEGEATEESEETGKAETTEESEETEKVETTEETEKVETTEETEKAEKAETTEEAKETEKAEETEETEKAEATEGSENEEKVDGGEKKEEGKNETKTKPKKKKMKTITVEKEKKRVHKVTLSVDTYHVGRIQPYSADTLAESRDKLAAFDARDAERIRFEGVKNKYESFIYRINNKLIDEDVAVEAVSTEEQRDALRQSSKEAEDWMYDEGYDADLVTYEDKYVELSEPAEKIFFRMTENVDRPKAIEAIEEKFGKILALLTKWETTMPQITDEERADVVTKVEEVKKALAEKVEAQAAADPTEDSVLTSAEIPLMTKEIQGILSKLSKRPKPKVEKKDAEDSNSTKSEDGEGTNSTEETDVDDADKDTENTDADEEAKDADGGAEDDKPDEADETATSPEDELSEEEKAAEDEL